ncbi:MAG TPA: hypothetical protein VK465_00805 [Fibrobacteria bacterium]|nr:hypothetical protein [Fibrobacteria bacterium]
MIRINLLKSLQAPRPFLLEEPKGEGRFKVVFASLLGVLVLGAATFFLYPGLFGKEKQATGIAAPAASDAPSAPASDEAAPKPKRVTTQAVEEIVRDIRDEQAHGAPAPTYANLVPSEKIEYQHFAATRILKDIKAVTPPDVGFSHFIFTPPGDFYVHGLAHDEATYKAFQSGLASLEGAEIRPGVSKAAAAGTGIEFSFYGTVKYPVTAIPEPPDRVVSKQGLQAELKQLRETAAILGIKLQSPRLKTSLDAGDFKKMVFQASADCNYQQMQDLLSQLHESKSNLGFLKFALKAGGDESVKASLDILAYVN